MKDWDVIVVGGGASGLMASCTAGERGLRVLLLEKMDQCGRKLRITGKGRCNLTNTAPLRDTLPHIGSDSRWLRNAYGRFFNRELMAWFEDRGTPLVEERGGRVFPASHRSTDIFLTLMRHLESFSNVDIRKNSTVRRLLTEEDAIAGVELTSGERMKCRQVILATGGMSYPTTGSTGAGLRMAAEVGHTIIDPVPSLVALRCSEKIPRETQDFALRNVTLCIKKDTGIIYQSPIGELSFTSDGIGGPLTLSASRHATRYLAQGQHLQAYIDLKPGLNPTELDRRLQTDLANNGTRIFNDALRLWLPAELIPLALPQLHIEYYKRLHQISSAERKRLGAWLKALPLTIVSTLDFDQAIVTQGGVALNEVNPKSMESKLIKGLFLVGELLDLDADTGGYNLQIAFSTGHAAGQALSHIITDPIIS